MFIGHGKLLERQHNERAWLAWHIVALPRAKKLPKLETLFARRKPVNRSQSPEELLAVVQTLNAMFGGIDKTKAKHGR